MLGNLVHINKYPTGKFGYVGCIPTVLAEVVPADRPAILGNRAHRDDNGNIVMYKFPIFDTAQDARDFAVSRNVELCQSKTCACYQER